MNKLTLSMMILLAVCVSSAQQPPAPQQSIQKEPPSHQTEFFQKATNGSIFIYNTQHDPCAPLPPDQTMLPLGSGFVTGVEKKGASTPQMWNGWKFLVTAKHVVANQSEIIVRVNAEHESKFVCKTLELQMQGQRQNVLSAPAGIDLVAISLPQIEGADPTVVSSPLLIDEAKMKDWNIGVGTQVLTVGYLYLYSGRKANFPVAKFGHISLITDEEWYPNNTSNLIEQGFVVDIAGVPGLSGAPVFAYGVEIETNPFRYRQLPPYVVGVVKGGLLAPVNGQMISQGVSVIEPATNLKALMRQVSASLKAGGAEVEDVN